MATRNRHNRGFTLVELMVVIVIVGIMATMAFVFVLDKPDKTKWRAAQNTMNEITKSLNTYAVEHDGSYPESLEGIASQFGGNIPKDPFSNENFQYELANDVGFRLRCLGKDKQDGGAEIPDKDIEFNKFGAVDDSGTK